MVLKSTKIVPEKSTVIFTYRDKLGKVTKRYGLVYRLWRSKAGRPMITVVDRTKEGKYRTFNADNMTNLLIYNPI